MAESSSTSLRGLLQHWSALNRYFSGAQARLFFEQEEITEISELNWTVNENVQPLYGYASFKPYAIMPGSRVIQGSFAIPFREPHYINKRIRQILARQKRAEPPLPAKPKSHQEMLALVDYLSGLSTGQQYLDTVQQILKAVGWGGAASKLELPLFPQQGINLIVRYEPETHHWVQNAYGLTEPVQYELVGVRLFNQNHMVSVNGTPVSETYHFLAQDLRWVD